MEEGRRMREEKDKRREEEDRRKGKKTDRKNIHFEDHLEEDIATVVIDRNAES